MGNTSLEREVVPWKGVTVSEQREQFLEDWKLNYYSKTDLADQYRASRKTAHKWIDRFEQQGLEGFHELLRRSLSCKWQKEPAIVQELVELRKARPRWVLRSCSP